ncbi:hypothetical protein QFJ66_20720 [Raoultella terrigena]|uniref:hypothetical protein n=1 Tax=Raoultella terrigena TaxID=577 RepID=UPI000F4C30E9|nr:hypothetical protein [Raoultella terrigena]
MSRKNSRRRPRKTGSRRPRQSKVRIAHPAVLFIKRPEFIGKLACGALFFGFFIYSLYDTVGWPLIALGWVSILLYPFAKKGADDTLLRLTSARVFEVIDGHRIGALYLFIVMPLTLPLAAGYFIYHTVKWRQMRRQADVVYQQE